MARRARGAGRSAATTFAIVDEVDSILIDEARTPLIISGRADDAQELYYQFARDREGPASATATTRSTRRSAPSCPPRRASAGSRRRSASRTSTSTSTRTSCTSSRPALRAKELFKRDVDYVVQDGEVKIVDEFTGRILEGRRWSEGLHQAVEAKEGVQIKEENQTLATVTLQNYFRMYDKLVGHDRHRVHRGRRVRAHLRPRGRVDPDQPADGPRRRTPTSSTRPRTRSSTPSADDIAERHDDGPAGARRHDLGREVGEARRACSRSGASRTRC